MVTQLLPLSDSPQVDMHKLSACVIRPKTRGYHNACSTFWLPRWSMNHWEEQFPVLTIHAVQGRSDALVLPLKRVGRSVPQLAGVPFVKPVVSGLKCFMRLLQPVSAGLRDGNLHHVGIVCRSRSKASLSECFHCAGNGYVMMPRSHPPSTVCSTGCGAGRKPTMPGIINKGGCGLVHQRIHVDDVAWRPELSVVCRWRRSCPAGTRTCRPSGRYRGVRAGPSRGWSAPPLRRSG